MALVPTLIVRPFEFFAGIQYAFGLGISYLPSSVTTVQTASNLSAMGVQGGLGYRINVGYLTDLSIRLRYELSLQQTPFVLQAVGLLLAIEFEG